MHSAQITLYYKSAHIKIVPLTRLFTSSLSPLLLRNKRQRSHISSPNFSSPLAHHPTLSLSLHCNPSFPSRILPSPRIRCFSALSTRANTTESFSTRGNLRMSCEASSKICLTVTPTKGLSRLWSAPSTLRSRRLAVDRRLSLTPPHLPAPLLARAYSAVWAWAATATCRSSQT